MKFDESIKVLGYEAVEWRKLLHQHPQTSYKEVFCRDFLVKKLGEFGIKCESGIAETGVVATVEGKSDHGKAIALRADIDALDIFEENDFAHRSKFEGKMHACGHDGHTTMLLATAKLLAETKDFCGKVHFIFQPAEEGGAGGKRMIEEGLFDKFPVQSVWGMHNMPGIPLGKIGTRVGALMASVTDFVITVKGKGGHAAMPHLSKDPVFTATQIITSLQGVISRQINPIEAGVISVTGLKGSPANNVISNECEFFGTFRALRPQVNQTILENIKLITQKTCEAFGQTSEIIIKKDPYPVLINSQKETEISYGVMEQCFGKDDVIFDVPPIMGGEDFAFLLNERPGCFVFIGNGAPGKKGSVGLHTSKYDFNDELIPYGITYWRELVRQNLAAA